MKLVSSSFENNKPIPKKHTCEGEDISPALSISDIPEGTKSLALIVDDPDAPSGTFDHWIAWNIAPTATIPEGETLGLEGTNGFGSVGYRGPCPPKGHGVHHYHFKLYALDTQINIREGASKGEVERSIKEHILGQTELIGTYERK